MKVFVFDLLAYGEQLDHLKTGSELRSEEIFLCACLRAIIAALATAALRFRAPAPRRALQDV